MFSNIQIVRLSSTRNKIGHMFEVTLKSQFSEVRIASLGMGSDYTILNSLISKSLNILRSPICGPIKLMR